MGAQKVVLWGVLPTTDSYPYSEKKEKGITEQDKDRSKISGQLTKWQIKQKGHLSLEVHLANMIGQ